jgi:hypothetical protein
MPLTLTLLPDLYAVARLDPDAPVPGWVTGPFTSVTRTGLELSIVVRADRAHAHYRGEHLETGFRILEVEGPLPFDAVGILASIAAPLAEAGVSILALGTFDTDYVLVKETGLERARAALEASGLVIAQEK